MDMQRPPNHSLTLILDCTPCCGYLQGRAGLKSALHSFAASGLNRFNCLDYCSAKDTSVREASRAFIAECAQLGVYLALKALWRLSVALENDNELV
jgi:hypothetical protein